MKGGTAALKDQMKLVDLSEIEDGLDDMADLLEEVEEINSVCDTLSAISVWRCPALLTRQ